MGEQVRGLTGGSFRMITLILSEHQCHKFSAIVREKQVCQGIILTGKGTVGNHVLSFLGIRNQKRILINVLLEKERVRETMEDIVERLKLNEPGHGIAYTTAVSIVRHQSGRQTDEQNEESGSEEESMYQKLTVIVNRGMADEVMDVARRSGARGGTILHGRGTGADCSAKLFGMEIEPEKELIIILVPSEIAGKVMNDVSRKLELDDPGTGILFAEPVWDVKGLVEDQ